MLNEYLTSRSGLGGPTFLGFIIVASSGMGRQNGTFVPYRV